MENKPVLRREFLKMAAMSTSAMVLPWGVNAETPHQGQPNILFILSDDQRFDTIHVLGNPEIQTPNLDKLVTQGIVFESCYIMGSMNAAVCIASRGMIFSGRTLFHLHQDGSLIPESEPTLPEIFRKQGYTTFQTGKWHQDKASYARSFTQGNAIHFSGMSDHYGVDVRPFDSSGTYPESDLTIVKGVHSSELFSNALVDFLNSEQSQHPFFAYMGLTAPHDPRVAPPEYRCLYDPQKLTLPPNFMPEHPFDNGELKVRDELLEAHPRDPKKIRNHLADYYAMITHMDVQIGRILQTLKDNGLERNTIVVFASDNGLAIGQHGLMGKQNLYEHSLRVPLILAGPGIPAGQRINCPVYLHDIFPTLCDLASIPIPETVEGNSLTEVIQTGTKPTESLLFAYKNFQRAIRKGPWKLIVYHVKEIHEVQLFNLEEDPHETMDRSKEPENKQLLDELIEELHTLSEKYDDPADIRKTGWGVEEIPAWPSR